MDLTTSTQNAQFPKITTIKVSVLLSLALAACAGAPDNPGGRFGMNDRPRAREVGVVVAFLNSVLQLTQRWLGRRKSRPRTRPTQRQPWRSTSR